MPTRIYPNTGHKQYQFFMMLVITFFTIMFVNDVVVYKLVDIDGMTISAASLIFPLTFVITDIISEVYGYSEARRIIWLSLIFNIVFSGLIGFLIHLPSPSGWQFQTSYEIVYKNIFFISVTHVIATPLGYLLNSYLLSKWKIMTKGRFFILRSITSSAIGEFAFSAAMVFIIWHGSSFHVSVMFLALYTYLSKLIWNVIAAFPAAIIIKLARSVDKVDVYDYAVSYTPFKY
ncbi:MAG: queuosine precursor transporter [Francisellaceae bacterium]